MVVSPQLALCSLAGEKGKEESHGNCICCFCLSLQEQHWGSILITPLLTSLSELQMSVSTVNTFLCSLNGNFSPSCHYIKKMSMKQKQNSSVWNHAGPHNNRSLCCTFTWDNWIPLAVGCNQPVVSTQQYRPPWACAHLLSYCSHYSTRYRQISCRHSSVLYYHRPSPPLAFPSLNPFSSHLPGDYWLISPLWGRLPCHECLPLWVIICCNSFSLLS